MFNGEFKIDTKAGVVVFCQKSHGKNYVSIARVMDGEEFNIGVGQLIAMKRNEIKIRKADIEEMRYVAGELEYAATCFDGIGHKLFENFRQITNEKIAASLNHIRELKKDLNDLYRGEYDELPEEVATGEAIYEVIDGSVALVKNTYNY